MNGGVGRLLPVHVAQLTNKKSGVGGTPADAIAGRFISISGVTDEDIHFCSLIFFFCRSLAVIFFYFFFKKKERHLSSLFQEEPVEVHSDLTTLARLHEVATGYIYIKNTPTLPSAPHASNWNDACSHNRFVSSLLSQLLDPIRVLTVSFFFFFLF